MVAAQNTVVRLVRIIGANLTYHALSNASHKVSQCFFSVLTYSIKIIAFHTTIQARAITQIIEVAEKYSFFTRYKNVKPGQTQKNQSKKVIIITQAIQKLANCHTKTKYIAIKEIAIAIHKSLKVSIVNSHSHHHSIIYVFQSCSQIYLISYGLQETIL